MIRAALLGLALAGVVGACGNGAVRGSRPGQGSAATPPAAPADAARPDAAPAIDAAPLTAAERVQRSGQPVASGTKLFGAAGTFVVGAGQRWLRVDATGVAEEPAWSTTYDGLVDLETMSVGRRLLISNEKTFRRVGAPSPKLRGRLRQLAVVGAREYWLVDDSRPRLYRVDDDGSTTRVLASLDRERGSNPGVSSALRAFCAQPNPLSMAASGDELVVLVATCSADRPVRVLTLDAADAVVATLSLPAREGGPGSFEPQAVLASPLGVFGIYNDQIGRADGDHWTVLHADSDVGYISASAIASDGAPWVLAGDAVWRGDGDALRRVALSDAAGDPLDAMALAGDPATGVVILARSEDGAAMWIFGERPSTLDAVAALDD